jgi:hypothetical protein
MCLTQGLAANCNERSNAGTIDKIYLMNCEDADFAGWVLGATGDISTLAVQVGGGFFEYDIKRDSGGYTGEFDGDPPNLFLTQTVTLIIPGMSSAKREVLMEWLNCNCGMIGIVQDNNCRQWVLGVNYNATCTDWQCRGLRVASGTTETTGIDPTADQNEYTVTLTATVFELAREYTGASIPMHP